MKKVVIWVVFAFLFVCATKMQAQTISGSIDKDTIRRGTQVSGKIILEITEDLHVNSSIPENEFTIPTTLKLTGSGIRITKIKYPKGVDRKFEFSETPINVYEKRTVLDFSFFVPRSFKGKIIKIRAVVGFQPCSAEVCYPPKREIINLTAKIK